MAYATTDDVQARMTTELTESQLEVCEVLLEDVAILIDSCNADASEDVKKVVSCRVVVRTLGTDDIPIGATQGSMSGLGYSQSWTIGNSGAVGELYLTKTERQMLGVGNAIGSHSPVEDIKGYRYDPWNDSTVG